MLLWPAHLVLVNDEESPEGEALVLLEDTVGPADGHGLVGQQGDLHVAEAALLPGALTPGQVGKVAADNK